MSVAKRGKRTEERDEVERPVLDKDERTKGEEKTRKDQSSGRRSKYLFTPGGHAVM